MSAVTITIQIADRTVSENIPLKDSPQELLAALRSRGVPDPKAEICYRMQRDLETHLIDQYLLKGMVQNLIRSLV